MATSSTKTNTVLPDFEAATERAREANDRLLEAGRKVSTAYLDGLEKYVSSLTQFERKISEQSQVETVASLFDTHAKVTEDVVKASVSAARNLIAVQHGRVPTARNGTVSLYYESTGADAPVLLVMDWG